MRAVFIAGAHTDIGKTHVACALIRAARSRGLTVEAFKPLVSGFDPQDWAQSDPGRLLTALGRPHEPEALDALSPWRFKAPLAPPMAARLEGRTVDFEAVAAVCRARAQAADADLLLIEGVGGVMSPIAEAATGLDLMKALAIPAVLAGGSYLGAVSHMLTAIDVIRTRNIMLPAVVVSESADAGAPDFAQTVATIAGFTTGPVFAAGRSPDERWASELLAAILA